MNNTLSHHGLSYLHPSYASHPSPGYSYPASAAPASQAVVYGRSNAGSAPPGMPPQLPSSTHSSGPHHGSHATLPSHVRDPSLGHPLLSASNVRSQAMYSPSSFFVNPYLSMPLSPGQQAAYGAHTHHYIAPPPDFNVTRGSNVNSTYRGDQLTGVNSSAAEGGRSQQPHYNSNTSALVPYSSPYPPPPPMYHTPFTAYGYPAEYSRSAYIHVDPVLLSELNDTHLSHLNTDDSPDKLQLRKRMDELIEQLLSVTPHEHKFSFAGVRETLEKSILELPTFDAFKASEAFDALASYATNLVSQPWRREYRTIKVYCGYWVHHVAEHLVGAEAILHLMGYQPMKRSRGSKGGSAAPIGCYQLPDTVSIVDGDLVTRLALDCHIACSECQVLGQLHQHLPAVPMTQLLHYRQRNIGSYQQMVQKLLQMHPTASSSPQNDEVDARVATLPPPKSYATSDAALDHRSSPSKGADAPSKTLAASQSQLQLSVSGRSEGNGRLPLSSLPTTPTCTASVLDRLRHSGGAEIDKRAKQLQLSDRPHLPATSPSQLMLEQFDNFVESTTKDSKGARPSRPERHRETLGRRSDDKRGGASVATATLIDHGEQHASRQDSRSQQAGGRLQQDVPISVLPKVLPHARSSKSSSRGPSGVVAPLDTGDACCLPATIPKEVFQDSTLDEHVSKAFSHSQHSHRASARDTANSNDEWDFVLKDLEKRGYNKDVGNRGDILQHVSRSSDTHNNLGSKTDTDGRADLIPSTVQAVKKDLMFSHVSSNTLNNHNNNLGELCTSLDRLQVGDRRAGAGAGSSGSSTARERGADRGRQRCGVCSSTVSDKRQSVYDNVSYEGFETARQDSDEEEDIRRAPADRTHESSSNYHANLLPGDKYSTAVGSSTLNEKRNSPQLSTNSSNNASNRQSGSTNAKSSKPNNKKLSLSAVLTGKLSNSESSKNKIDAGGTGKQKINDPVVPWSCIFCTFRNETSSNICEVCSRSRQDLGGPGPIKPLETGGKECQQCTLINDKSATSCSACNYVLDSCPTYI